MSLKMMTISSCSSGSSSASLSCSAFIMIFFTGSVRSGIIVQSISTVGASLRTFSRAFFEKYFGVGSSLEPKPESATDGHVISLYDLPEEKTFPLAAEPLCNLSILSCAFSCGVQSMLL